VSLCVRSFDYSLLSCVYSVSLRMISGKNVLNPPVRYMQHVVHSMYHQSILLANEGLQCSSGSDWAWLWVSA